MTVSGLFVLTLSAVGSVLVQQSSIGGLAHRMLQTGVVGTLVLGLALLALAWLTHEASPATTRIAGDSTIRRGPSSGSARA